MNKSMICERQNYEFAMKKVGGFTLVELLVVVAIVAVLIGVILVNFNPFAWGQKSRDAMRIQNLEDTHRAMALALADGEVGLAATVDCTGCTTVSGSMAVDGSGWVKFSVPIGKTGLAKYLPTLFADSLNNGPYVYVYGATDKDYELNAVLESPDNAARMSTDGGNAQEVLEVGTSLTIL